MSTTLCKGHALHVPESDDPRHTGQLVIQALCARLYHPALAEKLDPARIWVNELGTVRHDSDKLCHYLRAYELDERQFSPGALCFDRFGFDRHFGSLKMHEGTVCFARHGTAAETLRSAAPNELPPLPPMRCPPLVACRFNSVSPS